MNPLVLHPVSERARQARDAAERNVSGMQRARRKQAGRMRNAALTFAGNEVTSSGLIVAYE